MGWIRRNRFWFEHHDIYIEPTEEQKEISRNMERQSYGRLRNIITATAMIESMLIQGNRRRSI